MVFIRRQIIQNLFTFSFKFLTIALYIKSSAGGLDALYLPQGKSDKAILAKLASLYSAFRHSSPVHRGNLVPTLRKKDGDIMSIAPFWFL